MTAPNMDRLWTVVTELVTTDEHGKGHASIVGVIVDRSTSMVDFRSALEAGVRDVCILLPRRLLLVTWKRKQPGVLRTLRAARKGHAAAVEAVVDHESIPRAEVRSIELSRGTPPGWVISGGEFTVISTERRSIVMFVDSQQTDMARLEGASEWILADATPNPSNDHLA